MDEIFASNDFFRGGLALMLMGAVMAAIRYTPTLIWHIVQRKWAILITTRDQTLIQWISVWLAETEYGKRCQWLDVSMIHRTNELDAIIRPGIGLHSFQDMGTRYWIEHTLEDQGVAGKISVLTMRVLGRDPEPIRRVIELAVDMANAERFGKNIIYINDRSGYWDRIRLFPSRSGNSLFLRRGLFDEIAEDAKKFLAGTDWYRERGVPYRRGYLLYGPAGNGKSTVIQVLATELDLPIYLLSLSDPDMTDSGLARALGRTPDKCLLIIEDFEKISLEKTAMTVSGLLNAIDGPLASEGRLLIITANNIGAIDEYFLRPGRIDRQWLIDKPDEATVESCFNLFSPDGAVVRQDFLREAKDGNWTMARVQKELMLRTAH